MRLCLAPISAVPEAALAVGAERAVRVSEAVPG